MESLIRMLDQGTRLFDVALMLCVLRLTDGQLGCPVDDDRSREAE